MSPVIARMSVVLPAPFGPSRPVTPGPNEQLSSDSATFWRNHTDTLLTVTVAFGERGIVADASVGGTVIVPPSGSGAGAPTAPIGQRPRRRATIASSPPLAHAAERRPGIDVAEEHEVAQVQRQREHVDRARPAEPPLNCDVADEDVADAIDVTRKRPMIDAPATMRRSVSDEIATPITA